jgi:hypothetical protein
LVFPPWNSLSRRGVHARLGDASLQPFVDLAYVKIKRRAATAAGVSRWIRIDRSSGSNPRGRSRYMSNQFSALLFVFLPHGFQTLLVCSQAAILIDFLESFFTLLIASFLDWISVALFSHEVERSRFRSVRQPFSG